MTQPIDSPSAATNSGGSAPPRRRPRSRPSRTWTERGVIGVGVIGITMCLLTAGVLAWGLDKFESISTIEIAGVEAAEAGEPSNWLLVGTDSREGIDPDDPRSGIFLGEEAPPGKRTDTMIVVRVDPTKGQIDLLSIPRDLYVPLAGGGEGRINSTFNGEGGEARLVETISTQLGIEINHYAEVNFVGFQDIVDGLGGVPIWFDRPMRDFGSGLDVSNAGCHVLDGFQALALARGRQVEYFDDGAWRSDASGDIGRSTRQQYFLRRVADTVLNKVNITELGTLNRVLEIGGQNLTIDGGAEAGSLLALARAFGTISGDRIVGHALPVYDFRTSGGAAVLGLERELAEPTLAIFRGVEPVPTTEAPVPVVYQVLNGSRIAGQAGQAATALGAAGMSVESIDNGPSTERTIVRYPSSMASGAERLGSYLVVEPAYEIDESLTAVVLITGTDYDGLLATPRDSVALPAAPIAVPAEPVTVETTPTTALVGVVPGPTPEGTACG